MFSTFDSVLFRVSSETDGNVWPAPVRGEGAYYVGIEGYRYSSPHQLTVYCSPDPLVALTEAAYFQARHWHELVATSHKVAISYPLRTELLLWAFRIDPAPVVIDMEDPLASNPFGYFPQMLLNPGRNYQGTQDIADRVRTYIPPVSSGRSRPEGVKVPSVRMPFVKGPQPFQPGHLALFVMNTSGAAPFEQRSVLVAKMKVEFEFVNHAGTAVGYNDARIDWTSPKFRVSALPGEPALAIVPSFAARPKSKSYSLNRWHPVSVVF